VICLYFCDLASGAKLCDSRWLKRDWPHTPPILIKAALITDWNVGTCWRSLSDTHNLIDESEAARGIENEFGTQRALDYLVGEKFINLLEAAENNSEFQAEIPQFVAEIQSVFERWQLVQYLETARESEPFDHKLFEGDDEIDPEEVEQMRREDIRQCTRDLLLVERAKEWFFENS